ncbi:MAG: hypothetical protein ACFFER_14295 [Candidatus Thorarchaeota archaeon]
MPAEMSQDRGDAFRSTVIHMLVDIGFLCKGTKKPIECFMKDEHNITDEHTIDIIIEFKDHEGTRLLCPVESKRRVGSADSLAEYVRKLANEASCLSQDTFFSSLYPRIAQAMIITKEKIGARRLKAFIMEKNRVFSNRLIDINLIHGARFRTLMAASKYVKNTWDRLDSGVMTYTLERREIYRKPLPASFRWLGNRSVTYYVDFDENPGRLMILDMSGQYSLENWHSDMRKAQELSLILIAVHSIDGFSDDLISEASRIEPEILFVDHERKFCYFTPYMDYDLVVP